MLKIAESMNVTLFARDLRQTDTRILLQSFLSQWIPLSLSVLGKYILIHERYYCSNEREIIICIKIISYYIIITLSSI